MHPTISAERHALAVLCRRFRVARLEVFGSAARGDDFDEETSDADFLVTFVAGREPTFADMLDLEEALADLLGRRVDLVDRAALEASRNYIRRSQILAQAEPIYEG